MRFFVVIEFTKEGPRKIYEGTSEPTARATYGKLEHATLQSREGKTDHASDGSIMIHSEHK